VKNIIASIVAAAGIASMATAQTTQMDVQTSLDGVNWAGGNRTVTPGTTVQFRYSVSFVAGGTTAVSTGFASLTFQPTVSNWGTDTLSAFATSGNNTNGGAIDPRADYSAAGGFGRLKPFAATGPSTSQSYVVHQHAGGSGGAPSTGNFYRIARNDVTRWVGTGATSGTSAVNNFNGAGGVVAGQKQVPGSADPARVAGHENLLLAVLAMDTGSVPAGVTHTILAQAPTAGMSRNATTGVREASWYSSASDLVGTIKGAVSVTPAQVVICPAPGALALLGLGGLVAGRRRR